MCSSALPPKHCATSASLYQCSLHPAGASTCDAKPHVRRVWVGSTEFQVRFAAARVLKALAPTAGGGAVVGSVEDATRGLGGRTESGNFWRGLLSRPCVANCGTVETGLWRRPFQHALRHLRCTSRHSSRHRGARAPHTPSRSPVAPRGSEAGRALAATSARRVGGQLHWLPRARALPQPVSQGRRARSALGASGSATLLLLAPHRLYERERHFVGLARQRRAYGFKARHTRLESPLGPAARRLLGLLA